VEGYKKKLLEADKFIIERLYIVQLASVEGWKLANQVRFNREGEKEDEAYLKALKKREKDARVGNNARYAPYNLALRGNFNGNFRPRNNYRAEPNWQYNPGWNQGSGFHNQSMTQFSFPPPSSTVTSATAGQQMSASNVKRCLNCGSPAHFVKDCPTRPSYPLALNYKPQ